MSLISTERINDQQKEEDPSRDKLIFTYPLTAVIPTTNRQDNSFTGFDSTFITKYKFHAATWSVSLRRYRFFLTSEHLIPSLNPGDEEPVRVWNGSCYFSYRLLSENDILFYSSPIIKMLEAKSIDSFSTASGFMKEFDDGLNERKLAKIVILIELHLPTKYFYRPFDMPSSELSQPLCEEYPRDIEKDFRFEFLKESDFVIKCSDGSLPATRLLLNISSEFFKEHFKKFEDEHELTVEHSIDVVKPIITYLQTYYFQMPKVYDLDFAKRLFKAIQFFKPQSRYRNFGMISLLESVVHQAICKKFVEENLTFSSILQWLSFAMFRFKELQDMIITVIVDKFYSEWHRTFPENSLLAATTKLTTFFLLLISLENKMSLKDRIDEQQKENLLKGKVTFTYPWIITLAPANENNGQNREINFKRKFGTCYKFGNETWSMKLRRDTFQIGTYEAIEYDYDTPHRLWNGVCYLSYNLYYDNNMKSLYYSSRRIRMNAFLYKDLFQSPDGFMTKFVEAFDQRKIAKMEVSIEMHLPVKFFYQPFEKPHYLNADVYAPYPSNVESNFRYLTFKDNDYVVKCPDGEMPCRRIILNIASEFFHKHFKTSKDNEIAVEHLMDVVKPLVIFFRTRYFEMPKFYDLDYARRLFLAIEFFNPILEYIGRSVHRGLCSKFVSEDHDFDSILRWTKLAAQHDLLDLEIIIATVIAQKFYIKWQETFPVAVRNVENPLFLDIFGPERTGFCERSSDVIFEQVEWIYKDTLLTKVISP